jgi:hypothetical protein
LAVIRKLKHAAALARLGTQAYSSTRAEAYARARARTHTQVPPVRGGLRPGGHRPLLPPPLRPLAPRRPGRRRRGWRRPRRRDMTWGPAGRPAGADRWAAVSGPFARMREAAIADRGACADLRRRGWRSSLAARFRGSLAALRRSGPAWQRIHGERIFGSDHAVAEGRWIAGSQSLVHDRLGTVSWQRLIMTGAAAQDSRVGWHTCGSRSGCRLGLAARLADPWRRRWWCSTAVAGVEAAEVVLQRDKQGSAAAR